jgi:hypothetical protein
MSDPYSNLSDAVRESENSPSVLAMRAQELEDKIYDERRKHGRLLIEAASKVGVYVDDAEAWIASVQFDDDGSIRAELQNRITEAKR